MPRPKSIAWDIRVAVFLDYRRRGKKVNPVANRFNIARSTVRVIVKEFEDVGFSAQPRARVSEELLIELQETHLTNVCRFPRLGVGHLELGPGTSNEEASQKALSDPLPVQESSLWHLKGTKAEHVIQGARNAVSDYLQRESEAWRDLQSALETVCGLKERETTTDQDQGSHLFPALKHRLRNAFFERSFEAQRPPLSWLVWDLQPGDSNVLRLLGEPIGKGSSEDHQHIKEGVESFLTNDFRDHQRRALELHHLRQDMGLMEEIVGDSLDSVSEDELRRGICPACPYPEAMLD